MGGKCSREDSRSYPVPFTVQDLIDLQIGAVRDSAGGCCPSINGPQAGGGMDRCLGRGFSFPRTGEFEFVLGSGCSMCNSTNDGYGCQCYPGADSLGGQYPAVIRKSYMANPTQCCVKSASSIGDKTCDPKYRSVSSPSCKPLMFSWCDNATNFFTAPCKSFLKNNQKTDVGSVDDLANKYCPGSGDPFCACYNATVPPQFVGNSQAEAIFRCLNSNCVGQQALNTLQCPTTYVDCKIDDVSVTLNKSEAEKIQIANDCANIIIGNPSGTPIPTPSTPTPSTPSSSSTGKIILIVSVVVVLLAITAIIIALLVSKKKPIKRR